jgi:ketopantoate reductase
VKIPVHGAGVIGTLYGGELAEAGYNVTMSARSQRRTEISQRGKPPPSFNRATEKTSRRS